MLRRSSFRAKLFAASALALVAVAATLTLNQAALMRTALHQQLLNHAAEQKPFVVAAFSAPLVERDYASVQAITREAVRERGLAHLAVTDPRGNVIASQGWVPVLQPPGAGDAAPIEGGDGNRRMSFHAEIRIEEQLLGHAYFGLSYEPVLATLGALLQRGAVVALISLGLAVLLMEIIHRWLTRPLRELARASERIRDGDYDVVLAASSNDEIGALARSFRAMSAEIRARVRGLTESQEAQGRLLAEAHEREQALLAAKTELAAQSARLEVSLGELRAQEQLLAHALEHEREITQQQRRFVSVAAHEFRTPLTIIDGAAQRITRNAETLEPEELRERAGKIRGAVARMSRLIESTLDSSRSDLASRTPVWSEVDVAAMVRGICARAHSAGTEFALRVDGPAQALSVEGDARLLEQVFSKLVSNAIKYAGALRQVEVSLRASDDHVEVAIRDHGIGIPAADLPRLFARFFRASNAQAVPGTGLGLSVARDIVDLHGGTIAADSRLGEGTTFTVRLPIRRSAATRGPDRAGVTAAAHIFANRVATKTIH